jgi:hypothetical protein
MESSLKIHILSQFNEYCLNGTRSLKVSKEFEGNQRALPELPGMEIWVPHLFCRPSHCLGQNLQPRGLARIRFDWTLPWSNRVTLRKIIEKSKFQMQRFSKPQEQSIERRRSNKTLGIPLLSNQMHKVPPLKFTNPSEYIIQNHPGPSSKV